MAIARTGDAPRRPIVRECAHSAILAPNAPRMIQRIVQPHPKTPAGLAGVDTLRPRDFPKSFFAKAEFNMHPAPTRCLRGFILLICTLAGITSPAAAREPLQLGWLERVRLEPWGIVAKAKLDTGAKTAAIHATDIERFEKDDKRWVRFKLALDHRDPESETFLVERPLVRDVKIKLRGVKKNSDARPTVKLQFCLGGQRYEALFTLVNRSKFNYPVLLGRRFLADIAVIDPAAKYNSTPTCPKNSG
ncbi:MAG: ATP-dependent zinc protease [Gammaproteobacteria bacterium]